MFKIEIGILVILEIPSNCSAISAAQMILVHLIPISHLLRRYHIKAMASETVHKFLFSIGTLQFQVFDFFGFRFCSKASKLVEKLPS